MFDAWILPSRVADPSKKVPDPNCVVQDLLSEVVYQIKGAGSEIWWGPPAPNLTTGSAHLTVVTTQTDRQTDNSNSRQHLIFT